MTAQVWGYVKADPSGNVLGMAGPLGCTQVDIGTTMDVRNTVGPCGSAFGQSVF